RGERFVRPENGPTGRAGDHKDRPYRSDRIRQKLPLYSNGLLSGFPVGTCLRIAYEAPQQRRGNAVGAVFPHGSQAGDFVWKVAGRPSNAPDNWQRPRPLAIVLDNYSVHQSQSVQAQGSTLAAAGVTLFYWPAYAPELSAIEPLWTDVRYHQIPQRRYDLLGHRKSAVASALERKAKSLRAAQVKTDNLLPTPVQWLAVISQRPSRTRCLKVS
ncbi:MAG: transposase, partial [Armatimonadetes bacterium]|nr:transposase [Armatimonadota bacterium]